MEREISIEEVETFQTKGGNTRYTVRDENGERYTTFREQIGEAARRVQGGRARIRFHEQQRGQYTNVYLDAVEPLSAGPATGDDTEPEEAAWRTAVDAAPWLAGSSDEDDETAPDELFKKLKPFKERVAEDIRQARDDQ